MQVPSPVALGVMVSEKIYRNLHPCMVFRGLRISDRSAIFLKHDSPKRLKIEVVRTGLKMFEFF